MNKIEKLIKELCPNGVEWKSLGESCEIANSGRKPVKSSLRESGNIPYYGANNIQDYVNGYTHDGDYILIAEDGSASLENYSVQRVKGKFWANNHVHVIRGKDEVINGFLFHYFKYMNFSTYLTGGTRAKLTKSKLIEIKIPVPPLEIQEEIVKILDKFTDYVTELTLRQKQYDYYRDKLLSIENEFYEVEWKTIEQVFDVIAGGDVPKNNFSEQKTERYNIPILSNGIDDKSLYGWTDIPKIEKPSLTISARGTIGWTSHQVEPFYPIVRLLVLTPKIPLNLRYAYHYMKHIEDGYDVPKTGIPQLTKPMINNKSIPIPSIEIQSRIVQVLDNFDTVCNDLNIGLPKEIELRQKQYEFFRDKLLTFAAEGMYTDSTVQYRQDIIRLLQWVFGPIKVKLGSICDLERGKRVVKSQLSLTNGYPVFQNSLTPLGYFERNNRQAKNTFIVCAGAAGEVGFSKIPFWAADDIFTIDNSENIVSKYIYYVLLHQQHKLKSKVRMASIPRLSRSSIENIQFILPNIKVQTEIVNNLDKFNTICSDLSEGLPKEIELRQKQYEYYRDKQLTFD